MTFEFDHGAFERAAREVVRAETSALNELTERMAGRPIDEIEQALADHDRRNNITRTPGESRFMAEAIGAGTSFST